jgi:hypothetical protein
MAQQPLKDGSNEYITHDQDGSVITYADQDMMPATRANHVWIIVRKPDGSMTIGKKIPPARKKRR